MLALLLLAGFQRAGIGWFTGKEWPGSCLGQGGFRTVRSRRARRTSSPLGLRFPPFAPTLALSVAFIGVHSRYLRSSLLVTLGAPYITTARGKGLPERTVILRHALRNSIATFDGAFLLDFGAIFGAAMAVDYVFHLERPR